MRAIKKIDKTVWKETQYIAYGILLLSTLLQAVFLIIGKWNYTVLLGNLLSGAVAVLNFFLMGLTVQNALSKEEKDAKTAMKVSQLYRNLLLLAVAVLGLTLSCFNSWTTLIPLFFPRVAIAFRPLFDKKSFKR
ncbi:MAG: hypothetical protein E7414_01635 [Ruminococcaceae bacterium]|nr:hypothetical protein [Oscillospiraceae bacterium]